MADCLATAVADIAGALALVDAALRGAAVALLLLMALRLWRERLTARPAGRLLAGFSLALCVQVISSTPMFENGLPPVWQALPVGISVGNSVLFWLFAQVLFDDDFTIRRWHAVVWFALFVCGVSFCLTLDLNRSPDVANAVMRMIIRGAPLLFVALTVLVTVRRWSVDLLERRRRLRGIVIVGGTLYTLAMVVLRLQSSHGILPAPSALLDIATLLIIISVVAGSVTRLRAQDLFTSTKTEPTATAPSQPTASPPDDPELQALLNRLSTLMTRQRAYAQENLTIAGLAEQLNVPEYRLRRAINGSLGHRNFNAYVNEFRLREAQAALVASDTRELPVLTIALTAGFQSIGPFNRAFKTMTGLTPTEFRHKHSADSEIASPKT